MGSDSQTGSMAGIEGTWTGERVKVQLRPEGPNTWKLSAKVANTMGCTVTKTGDCFSAGPVMSTKMMPVPILEEREAEISQVLNGLTNITREGSQLCLTGGS